MKEFTPEINLEKSRFHVKSVAKDSLKLVAFKTMKELTLVKNLSPVESVASALLKIATLRDIKRPTIDN